MLQSTQKLLDQFLPKLQSIARKLATNRQVQEDLVQEMSLHLCQLIMEGNAPPDDGVTGEGKSVPHKRCSACRGGLAAITKDIAMCLKCGSVFEELVM